MPGSAAEEFVSELQRTVYRDRPDKAEVIALQSVGWHGHMFARCARALRMRSRLGCAEAHAGEVVLMGLGLDTGKRGAHHNIRPCVIL